MDRETRGTDNDPTRPVFFSLRPEYSDLGDARKFALIFRYDTAIVRSKTIGAILRVEVPVTAVRAGAESAGGIGDVYAQILVPWFLTRRFALAAGAGIVVPTADSPDVGGGRWTITPIVAPVWRVPRGLFYVKVQQFPDSLLVTPTFIHVISRDWWVTADSESSTNVMPRGRTDLKSGVQLGRIVARGLGAWIKPEIWWGPTSEGRWNLKFGLVWYERRPQR